MAKRRRRLTGPDIRELPLRQVLARDRALEALSLMRSRGLSLEAAAERVGTTRRTVLKYAGRALEKTPSGVWVAKDWDRIIRRMRWLTPTGVIVLPIRDSRSAQKISRYWAAVDRYLKTGFTGDLEEFRGEVVQVDGVEYEFVLDPRIIDRLANAGQVSFPDIYALTD